MLLLEIYLTDILTKYQDTCIQGHLLNNGWGKKTKNILTINRIIKEIMLE